jgi:hypothetical protein
LPAGKCVVSTTLVLRGVGGMTLQGQGAVATELVWRSKEASPMFLLDHTFRAKLSDFSITPADPFLLKTAIRIENGAGCSADPNPETCVNWASSQAVIEDVAIRGRTRLETGVHVRLFDVNADEKNDHHRFNRVLVNGYTRSGFVLEGRNAKALSFTECLCLGAIDEKPFGRSCIDTEVIPRHGASFSWRGGAAVGHTDVDFSIGDRNDALLISAVYSEKSSRFLRVRDSSHVSGMPFPVTVESVRFANNFAAVDGEVVQFFSTGPLTITGGRWGSEGAPKRVPRFRFDPPGVKGKTAAAFVFTGNYVTGPSAAIFPAKPPTVFAANVLPGL